MMKAKYSRFIALLITFALALGGVSPAIGQIVSQGFDLVQEATSSRTDFEATGHCEEHEKASGASSSVDQAEPGKIDGSPQMSVSSDTLSDCCGELCFCSQSGCQSINITTWSAPGILNLVTYTQNMSESFYQTPSFDRSNPPPIF